MNFYQILNILKKKMVVIANVLPLLQTIKELVRRLYKRSRFRTTFDGQNIKGSTTLLKLTWEHFINIFKLYIPNAFPRLETVKDLVRPISKKARFRTSFDSQHVKASQKFVKSAREHFYHVLPSLWWEIIWKISLLLIYQILGVFFNTLAADAKCPVQECEILSLLIEMKLSKNQKHFSQFFVPFMEFTSNFKKMILIANAFPKLQTVKHLVRLISKRCCFRTPFDSQHVKESQTLVRSPWVCFFHVFSSLWWELIWKIYPLVICKILGVFVDTFTADDKYPLPDHENLLLPIQMQLS